MLEESGMKGAKLMDTFIKLTVRLILLGDPLTNPWKYKR